mgnify:CR=1 FL=1
MRPGIDMRRAPARTLFLIALLALSGCVSQEQMADENSGYVEYDPLEPLNRKVHAFNMAADRAVMRPIARGYRKVVPSPVRSSITNFFSNLRTPGSALNNFLQGKPKRGFSELGRFLFNSTLGLGGLFDARACIAATGLHRQHRIAGGGLEVLDHRLDFFGRGLCAAGQSADLVRNHREALTGVTCHGCLNRCVQRQNVRLVRDVVNQCDDVTNFL